MKYPVHLTIQRFDEVVLDVTVSSLAEAEQVWLAHCERSYEAGQRIGCATMQRADQDWRTATTPDAEAERARFEKECGQ